MSTVLDQGVCLSPLARIRDRLLATAKPLVIWSFPVLAVFLMVVLPMASFLALAFWPDLFGSGNEGFTLGSFIAALSGYNLKALINSFWVGLGAGIVGTVIGVWLAWLSTGTDFYGRKLLDASVWLILILPSYLMAVGWQVLLSPGGLVTLPWLSSVVLGPVGVVMVLAFKGVPFAYLAMVSMWRTLPAEFDEAARVHGVKRWTRMKLSLRLLLPGLIAGFSIIYAESLSDFGVAATLAAGANFPLGTYAIYSAINSQPLNFSLAAASSWLLLILVIPAIWLQARINRQAARYSVFSGRSRSRRRLKLGRLMKASNFAFLILFIAMALGVPLLAALGTSLEKNVGMGLSRSNITFHHYIHVFTHLAIFGVFRYSVKLSLLAALVAVIVGLAMTFLLQLRGPLARLLDGALLTIMALPGLILAAGYIFTFNQPWLPLYGGSFLLGMAYVTVVLPIAARMLLGPVSQQHKSLHEAARVHGLHRSARWGRIRLPLLATPLLLTWLLTACHLMFELPASELLYPPGSPTLAVALVSYIHNFRYGTESALQITAVAVVGLTVGLAQWLFSKLVPVAWRRGLDAQNG